MRNKELHRKAVDKYQHSPKGRKRILKYRRERRENERKEIISLLGGRCCVCGFDDFRALQIDHVIPCGGNIRKTMSSITYYSKILIEIKAGNHNYQCLCANHNWIKRIENEEL